VTPDSAVEGPVRTRSAVLVTASEPEPRTFGKQVVIGGLLDHLCDRLGPSNVTVVLVGRPEVARPPTPYRLHVVAKPSATDQLRAALTRVPFGPRCSLQEAALWSPRIRRELGDLLAVLGADLEIWDTMRMGQYARTLPRRPRVLYADDLFSKRYASMLERVRTDPTRLENPLGEFGRMLPGPVRAVAAHPAVYRPLLHLERRRTARSEDRAPADFDATVLVNQEETAELVARTGNASVTTLLPLITVGTGRGRHYDGTPTFVFLGGLDFPPNRDGLTWFLGHCREAVLDAVPDFRLLVVGRGSDTALPAEAAAWGDHVAPLGWVDDLDEVLGGAAALISPLRIGSGTKIKVLEALARGLPVVATPHGVLGLPVGPRSGCLVGSEPASLAAALAEVADPVRNAELSRAATRAWTGRFAPPVAGRAYDEVLGLRSTPDVPPAREVPAA
jgi:glycosyltransferase involved in cell wall biosynthesis